MRTTIPSLAGVLALLSLAGVSGAQTLHVDASNAACPGSGTPADPYCTISDAVDAAAPGTTIEVAPGTYFESVSIATDGLTLRGAGADRTTIVGDPVSHVVGPDVFANVPSFSIEGFRITTSDPGPGIVSGIRVDPQTPSGIGWHVNACVIEGVDLGLQLSNLFWGSSVLVENTVVKECGAGAYIYGVGITIRNCTIARNATYGIASDVGGSDYEVSNSILASNGWWAVQRSYLDDWDLHHLLLHDNNKNNPAHAPDAGPFVEYLPEKGGFWLNVPGTPGPVNTGDPLFMDLGGGDLRITLYSPARENGDPSTPVDPAFPYDVSGFGHPRVDGLAVTNTIDIGAHEYGGLIAEGGEAVGEWLTVSSRAPPQALYGVFVGFPGLPIDLGAKGTVFLDPGFLLLVHVGISPTIGPAVNGLGIIPPEAAGLTISLQMVSVGGPTFPLMDWTNLEQRIVAP